MIVAATTAPKAAVMTMSTAAMPALLMNSGMCSPHAR
jgi:hypothetical protein